MVYVTLSADTVRSTHWRKTLSITDVTAQIADQGFQDHVITRVEPGGEEVRSILCL